MSFWGIETDAQFVVVNGSTLKWSSQSFLMSRNAFHKEMPAHNRIPLFSQSLKTFKFGIKQVDHNGQISTMKG